MAQIVQTSLLACYTGRPAVGFVLRMLTLRVLLRGLRLPRLVFAFGLDDCKIPTNEIWPLLLKIENATLRVPLRGLRLPGLRLRFFFKKKKN